MQPEETSKIATLKQKPKALLKDLLAQASQSHHYEDLIERVTDDLLENVDKQLDLYKSEKSMRDNPENYPAPIVSERFY